MDVVPKKKESFNAADSKADSSDMKILSPMNSDQPRGEPRGEPSAKRSRGLSHDTAQPKSPVSPRPRSNSQPRASAKKEEGSTSQQTLIVEEILHLIVAQWIKIQHEKDNRGEDCPALAYRLSA
jgi:hypothetical protein